MSSDLLSKRIDALEAYARSNLQQTIRDVREIDEHFVKLRSFCLDFCGSKLTEFEEKLKELEAKPSVMFSHTSESPELRERLGKLEDRVTTVVGSIMDRERELSGRVAALENRVSGALKAIEDLVINLKCYFNEEGN